MKRLAALALAWVLLLSAFPVRAEEEKPAWQAEADAFFARLFAQKKTVGGAVIVNLGGERRYAYFHGRSGKRGTAVTEETVFKVASVTKLITAIGVMQLVEQGKLDLDAALKQSDGKAIRNPRYPKDKITLRQAMSHTTSLLPSANYTATPTWSDKYFDETRPGTHYTYANLNGGILGSLIEQASGQSLNAYMAEHVFSPLGINAAYASTLLPDPDKLSYSFASDGTVYSSAASYLRVDASYDDTCNPAAHFRMSVGNLYISVRGLELLGSALANRGVINGVQLLSPGSVRLMQMDQSALPGSSVTGASPYGLNTFRYDLLGHTWYGHQGWWSGRLVDLFYEPESHTSVVLVMNGSERTVGTVNREVAAQMERTLTYVTPWVDEALSDMTILDEEWE